MEPSRTGDKKAAQKVKEAKVDQGDGFSYLDVDSVCPSSPPLDVCTSYKFSIYLVI